MSKEMKQFTINDIAAHKDAGKGMYIVIDNGVYDVTGMFYPRVLASLQLSDL